MKKKLIRWLIIILLIYIGMNIFNISIFIGNKKLDRYYIKSKIHQLTSEDRSMDKSQVKKNAKSLKDKIVEKYRQLKEKFWKRKDSSNEATKTSVRRNRRCGGNISAAHPFLRIKKTYPFRYVFIYEYHS